MAEFGASVIAELMGSNSGRGSWIAAVVDASSLAATSMDSRRRYVFSCEYLVNSTLVSSCCRDTWVVEDVSPSCHHISILDNQMSPGVWPFPGVL